MLSNVQVHSFLNKSGIRSSLDGSFKRGESHLYRSLIGRPWNCWFSVDVLTLYTLQQHLRSSLSEQQTDRAVDLAVFSSLSVCCCWWAAAGGLQEVDGVCLVFRECSTAGVMSAYLTALQTLPHTLWVSLTITCLINIELAVQVYTHLYLDIISLSSTLVRPCLWLGFKRIKLNTTQ